MPARCRHGWRVARWDTPATFPERKQMEENILGAFFCVLVLIAVEWSLFLFF